MIENSCSGYHDDDDDGAVIDVDTAWKAARAFGILALVIGGVNLFYYSYWQSFRKNQFGFRSRKISGAIFIVASFYQGLTLFFLRSSIICTSSGTGNKFLLAELGVALKPAEIIYDEQCALSIGAYMGIASTICWFAAGVFSCIEQRKVRDVSQDAFENEAIEDGPHGDDDVVEDVEKSADSSDTAIGDGANSEGGDGADSEERKTQLETTELEG